MITNPLFPPMGFVPALNHGHIVVSLAEELSSSVCSIQEIIFCLLDALLAYVFSQFELEKNMASREFIFIMIATQNSGSQC